MVTIACVLKSGGCYTPEYVHRLRDSVAKNTAAPHRFVCLTDMTGLTCESIPLTCQLPGWWSKLELFKLEGPVVYLDLDTVVTGDITHVIEHPHRFTMLSNLDGRGGLASGMMAWSGDFSYLLHRFNADLIPQYSTPRRWGDQGWIAEQLEEEPERFQELWPGLVSSYMWSSLQDKQAAHVVIYHGEPRPHMTGWATT